MEADIEVATFGLNLRQSFGDKIVDSESGLGVLLGADGETVDDVQGQVVFHSELLGVQEGPVILNLGCTNRN